MDHAGASAGSRGGGGFRGAWHGSDAAIRADRQTDERRIPDLRIHSAGQHHDARAGSECRGGIPGTGRRAGGGSDAASGAFPASRGTGQKTRPQAAYGSTRPHCARATLSEHAELTGSSESTR
jgi:hypothetical protein